MFPATTKGLPPTNSCQSVLSASASTTSIDGNRRLSEGTRSRSFSMQISRFVRLARASVSPPGPGPISKTVSSGAGATASAMRARIRGSERKCWPRRFLAWGRSDAEDKQGPVVGRMIGEGIGKLEHRAHDLVGRLTAPATQLLQQHLLGKPTLGAPRVDETIGPEAEQVLAWEPRHLVAPDRLDRSQTERRCRSRKPLGRTVLRQ